MITKVDSDTVYQEALVQLEMLELLKDCDNSDKLNYYNKLKQLVIEYEDSWFSNDMVNDADVDDGLWRESRM